MDTPGHLVPLPAALHQRAGDADRSAVCDQLAAHRAAGRLREDELDARLSAAVSAPTLIELRRAGGSPSLVVAGVLGGSVAAAGGAALAYRAHRGWQRTLDRAAAEAAGQRPRIA